MRPCRPRPLQCDRCGGLDHATASCNRDRRCWRCGGSHPMAMCKAAKPFCTNCGGPHTVLNRSCPRWQKERRVCAALARAQAPTSRVDAQADVRAAAQLKPPLVTPATSMHQHPRSSSCSQNAGRQQLRHASPVAPAQQQQSSQAPPARPRRGRWSLRQQREHLDVLRSVGELLPVDNPLRPLCVQAVQGRPLPEPHHG